MTENNLKQKAAAGMIWTALQKYSTMFISFISGIILARLLTPHDYGCIGMLSIFMVLAGVFIDGGFGSALIQKKKPSQTDYSTVFYWNMGMSVIVYAILFLSAPAIARYYNIPILSPVLRIQGLVLIINAFNIIQSNQLRKKINFKAIAIVTISTSLISLIVTIWMAYNGFGVWSLVAQNIITASIPTIVFWFYVKWRPTWEFSWNSFRELFSFGFFMFLTHMINNISSQIQGLLIGKIYNPTTMGYYSKALSTEQMASQSISSVMSQVTYPLYAQVQDDRDAMINIIKRLTMTISYFTFPMMFLLILTAKPMFVLLYSDRWLQSVPYFQILCFAGMANCLISVNLQTISAVGKSKTMFVWTVIKRVLGICFVICGLIWFGMKGLLCGAVLNTWFSFFVNIWLVSKHIGYKWTRQLLDLLPVVLASFVAAVVSYGFGYFLELSLYPDGIVKAVVYLMFYLGWSFVCKPKAYTYVLNSIPARFKFWERKQHK